MKFLFLLSVLFVSTSYNPNLILESSKKKKKVTAPKKVFTKLIIDDLNGIPVYYNGKMKNVHGRHLTKSGYNLGLKWQCVEFVKRYYYEYFNHKMPNTYGHAKDFFDPGLGDTGYNKDRGLLQFRNARIEKPKVNDILVFKGSEGNPYGHIAIISKVKKDGIEIIQQNWGKHTRKTYELVDYQGIYTIADFDVLGWLRIP